jgi:hypothetical protein
MTVEQREIDVNANPRKPTQRFNTVPRVLPIQILITGVRTAKTLPTEKRPRSTRHFGRATT